MEWWENGDYDGTDCRHCGRQRVMVCDAPDGTERRVCEKCGWDQSAERYAVELVFGSTPDTEPSRDMGLGIHNGEGRV